MNKSVAVRVIFREGGRDKPGQDKFSNMFPKPYLLREDMRVVSQSAVGGCGIEILFFF
jgi:hypothetical protein